MKYNKKITIGYKATDKDMKCQGFQFELGKWFEHEGELELCKSGFHFCIYPSGVWSYYSESTTRVFKVEVEDVLDTEISAGADVKLVCSKIKFLEEICISGDRNTGDRNTGYCNTGDWNTGYCNTGDCNTGDRNTGDCNTGYCNTGDSNTGYRNTGDRNTGYCNTGDWNTGYRNTGDRNTGYCNTGYCNTGDWNTGDRNTGDRNTGYCNTGDWNTGYRNTGDWNTGYRNTGDWNTGDWNTGYGNATNRSSGFFCTEEPNVMCFDVCTGIKHAEFIEKYPEYYQLSLDLLKDSPINYELYKNIPNITEEKLKKLHKKFIEGRKKK